MDRRRLDAVTGHFILQENVSAQHTKALRQCRALSHQVPPQQGRRGERTVPDPTLWFDNATGISGLNARMWDEVCVDGKEVQALIDEAHI